MKFFQRILEVGQVSRDEVGAIGPGLMFFGKPENLSEGITSRASA